MSSPAFLYLSLTLFIIWCVLFFFSKSTRREQMFMSLIGLVLSPAVMLIALSDLRRTLPFSGEPIRIEDFLFAFSFAGIAAVIYQVIVGKHLVKLRRPRIILKPRAVHWFSQLTILFAIWASISLLATLLFAAQSVHAFLIGGLLVGTYMIADRQDLLLNALVSGAFMTLLLLILEHLYFVRLFPTDASDLWHLGNLSGAFVGAIPIEELLWIAIVGFAIGPMYEYVRRYRLK
jgi:hypothetical protein